PLSSTAAGSMAFGVDNEEPRDLPTPMSFKEEEKSSIPAGSKRARSDKDLPDYGDMYSEELPAASAAAATGSALVPFGIPKSDKDIELRKRY
ncbi:hypothetical protein EBQ93_01255, partial [bacterium]|nr:hypothetical protein [bacterium]